MNGLIEIERIAWENANLIWRASLWTRGADSPQDNKREVNYYV